MMALVNRVKRRRVLVADDHAVWRREIARVLQPECEVAGYAERGDAVLETAAGLQPDVVTLDVSLPGESGLNVLPALRAELPDAVIVIVSATATRLYREEAFRRGADAYIEKGRIVTDLLPAVVAGRRERRHRTAGLG